MNPYPEALYQEVQDRRVGRRLWGNAEYCRLAARREAAYERLTALLDEPQLAALEDFQTLETHAACMEDAAMFQEAVTLGKWMVR